MERRVAMELLGLEPSGAITLDQARRAYLRRLRLHPPERDPEGFRRLREAFELVRRFAAMIERSNQWLALHAELRGGTPVAPDPAIAHEAIHEAVHEAADNPAALDALMELVVSGVTDEPPATAAGSTPRDPAPVRPRAPHASEPLAAAPAGAVPYGPDATEPLATEPSPRAPNPLDVSDAAPSLHSVTDEILAALERGDLDAALELANGRDRSAADDHRAVRESHAARWALTRELLEVAAGLPSTLRSAVARAIAADQLALASAAVESYESWNHDRVKDLRQYVVRRAPSLYKAIWDPVTVRPAPGRGPSTGRSLGGSLSIVLVVVIALSRLTGSCDSRTNHDRPFAPIELPPGTRLPELKSTLHRGPAATPPPQQQLQWDPQWGPAPGTAPPARTP